MDLRRAPPRTRAEVAGASGNRRLSSLSRAQRLDVPTEFGHDLKFAAPPSSTASLALVWTRQPITVPMQINRWEIITIQL